MSDTKPDTKVETQQQKPQDQVSLKELSKKVKDTTNEVNQLKNGLNVYTNEEKDRRLSEIEDSILDCTQDLQYLETETLSNTEKDELNKLKTKINTLKSSKDQLKQQIEKETKTAIDALSQEVAESQSQEGPDKSEEEKKEKRKKILGILGGVGIVAGTVALCKRVFGGEDWKSKIPLYDKMSRKEKRQARKKRRKEHRGDGSFRERPLGKVLKWTGIGTAAYYVAHGIYTQNWNPRDMFDWEKGKKLSFDEALNYCKGAIANQDNVDGMAYDMNLQYHEDTGEIEAYGEKIKIDKNKRMIEGLDVKFKKYEHMINTAIVVAFLKKNYAGKCANNNPFDLSGSWKGNINVNTSDGEKLALDGTGNAGKIIGVSAAGIGSIAAAIRGGGLKTGATILAAGGILGYGVGAAIDADNIMHDNMPELDNENGRKRLSGYLNGLGGREARKQTADDITESPIKQEIVECMETIQDTNPELTRGNRNIDAIQDPNDETKYTIKAYGRDFSAEVTGSQGNRKIKILGISGGNPTIKTDMETSGISNLELPLKEGCYMSCLVGFFLDNFHHKGNDYPRFRYGSRAFGIKKGLYFSDENLDTYALTEDKFQERMPTLFNKEKRNKFLKFLNDGIKGNNNVSIWKK